MEEELNIDEYFNREARAAQQEYLQKVNDAIANKNQEELVRIFVELGKREFAVTNVKLNDKYQTYAEQQRKIKQQQEDELKKKQDEEQKQQRAEKIKKDQEEARAKSEASKIKQNEDNERNKIQRDFEAKQKEQADKEKKDKESPEEQEKELQERVASTKLKNKVLYSQMDPAKKASRLMEVQKTLELYQEYTPTEINQAMVRGDPMTEEEALDAMKLVRLLAAKKLKK